MHGIDQAVDYLSTHRLVLGACIVWYACFLAGLHEAVDNWRDNRIMKRTGELRKKRLR